MDTIQILMSTYNGVNYIDEQIESIRNQKNVNVKILVRDDGSNDGTKEKLDIWAEKGALQWYTNSNLGAAKSFMNLIYNAPEANYYAFCDQDDVWKDNKLYEAIKKIKKYSSDVPVLYSSPTILVDKELNLMKNEPEDKNYSSTFEASLVCSNTSGCTMVFNRCLLEKIQQFKPEFIMMHDGWIHKVCLFLDGVAIRDTESYILYRQHGNNVIGGEKSVFKNWKRRVNSIKKNSCCRSRQLKELYNGYSNIASEEKRNLLYNIAFYKDIPFGKLKLVLNSKIKTQNYKINFYYVMAILLGVF